MDNKEEKIVVKIDENFIKEYEDKIKRNPTYSIEVDPKNYYHMSEQQKDFVKYYVEFKCVTTAAKLTGIDIKKAMEYYRLYAVQDEIRRINRALYQRQFAHKMLSLNDIGGWLSSVLVDDIPIGDRVRTVDKIKIAQMIMDIHKTQMEVINNPTVVAEADIKEDISKLSINAIKQLLDSSKDMKAKDDLINKELNKDNLLSQEEINYLKTLSYKELLELIDSQNEIKGGK